MRWLADKAWRVRSRRRTDDRVVEAVARIEGMDRSSLEVPETFLEMARG